jgi:S-adenosylhomocysteine hydrolase
LEKDGALKMPVMAVNDAMTKFMFDKRFGRTIIMGRDNEYTERIVEGMKRCVEDMDGVVKELPCVQGPCGVCGS